MERKVVESFNLLARPSWSQIELDLWPRCWFERAAVVDAVVRLASDGATTSTAARIKTQEIRQIVITSKNNNHNKHIKNNNKNHP